MAAPHLLGIDLGTTGVKAMLVDTETGAPAGAGTAEYPSITTADGGHEQDPHEWWSAVVVAVRQVLHDVAGSSVVAVGLSGHMHAVTLIGADDLPVRPALTWADRRAHAEVQRLRRDNEFRRRCVNPIVEAFSAPKLAWIARNEPQALGAAVRMVQPKDVIRHRLTGTWGTDTSDAVGTLLYDVHRHDWDARLWELAGANTALAPKLATSSEVVGTVLPHAANETGLPAGIPVVAGAADAPAAVLGAGVSEPGIVYINTGTAAQVMTPVAGVDGRGPDPGPLFLFGQAGSRDYLIMASMYAAGMSIRWAERELLGAGSGAAAGAADRLAEQSAPGADGLVYLPFMLGASAPVHDDTVRAALLGQGPEHGRAHIARAVVEAVAFGCVAAADAVLAQTGQDPEGVAEVRVGGGVARSPVWREAVAALCEAPVAHLRHDASPRGAALLAGVGAGIWSDIHEAARTVAADRVLPPAPPERDAYRRARARYDAAAEAVTALKLERYADDD